MAAFKYVGKLTNDNYAVLMLRMTVLFISKCVKDLFHLEQKDNK